MSGIGRSLRSLFEVDNKALVESVRAQDAVFLYPLWSVDVDGAPSFIRLLVLLSKVEPILFVNLIFESFLGV